MSARTLARCPETSTRLLPYHVGRASGLVFLIAAGDCDIAANMLTPRGLVRVSRSFLQDPLSTRDLPKLRLPWHYIYSNGSEVSGC